MGRPRVMPCTPRAGRGGGRAQQLQRTSRSALAGRGARGGAIMQQPPRAGGGGRGGTASGRAVPAAAQRLRLGGGRHSPLPYPPCTPPLSQMATAMKPAQKPGVEEADAAPIHRIRITLTSKSVRNLEKGERGWCW